MSPLRPLRPLKPLKPLKPREPLEALKQKDLPMRPVVFDGCFGWLHPAEARHPVGAGADHGVVLCSPFGYDELCTHRGWRRLAERIAAAGMPVLRFDYPGAGDSLGTEEDPNQVEAWIDSIATAVRYLRQWTGVTQVSLCGLRLGATFAAVAAQRMGGVDGLVLLSPALSGKNYVRELRAHRQGWLSTEAGAAAEPIPESAAYVEAVGFGWHGDEIARLSAIDLRTDTRAPARRVLLLDSSNGARATALAGQYAANGVEVEQLPFDESDRFMLEALYSEEPVEAFSAVTRWLSAEASSRVLAEGAASAPGAASHELSQGLPAGLPAGLPEAMPTLRLAQQRAVERAVVFGPYFGIYCQPDVPRAGAPAMLLFNTGASHHIGDGRIFVTFARKLAAQGIASLRMDLGGLGESTPAAEKVTLDTLYADQASVDAMAGADWLVSNGHAGVVTFGVCGGAFVGLHAADMHPAILGCFSVNVQKFVWDDAARVVPGVASTRVLQRSALSLDKWKRVLRGESSLRPAVMELSRRMRRRFWRSTVDLIENVTGVSIAPTEVQRLMQRLNAKGVQVQLVYGEFDLGRDELKIQFGTNLGGLRRLSHVRVVTLPHLDHVLFTARARESAMAEAQTWLYERFMTSQSARIEFHGPVPARAPRVAG
jgi:alpha-beta hydrolase superfamily lysophospholipase